MSHSSAGALCRSATACCEGRLGCTPRGACGYGTGVKGSAAVTAGAGVHGFPAVLTSFVGREEAVRVVGGLLAERRLVTVAGPGGSGKTRLAGVVAERVAGRFADGVWLVELAPVRDPALVPSVVAAALGVREQPGVPAAQALARVLARLQVLLVLDNCEHVIGAAAGLCAGLLAAADDVRVLATSREPLQVAGEARYRLAPLPVPGPDDADVGGSEAVALFADRARQVDAEFTLDGQAGPVVARLVARLDGMPLAIELAAARVETLGVAQLLDRIGDRFALLTAGDRLAPARQRSLEATVRWSYELLGEAERGVFRAVSVFPGPFTLEAAEAVAGPGAGPAVLHLVDCSLLSPPRADPDGRSRYVMLETLRAFGAGLLARAGEQAAAEGALAGYALQVAEEAAAGLETSTAELAAARRLDAEDATMRQALTWALEQDAVLALRVAAALAPWWSLRGRAVSQYPLLCGAAGRAAPGSEPWCTAQYWLGNMALDATDPAGALGHFDAVIDAMRDRRPYRAVVYCLGGRSVALLNLGRITEAADDGHRALAVARELRDPGGESGALSVLSHAAFYAGDPGSAVHLARQAGQIPGDIPGWIARMRSIFLTLALTEAGDLAAARPACMEGLARSRAADDLWAVAGLLNRLAMLDLRAGRIQDATAHVREALQIAVRADLPSTTDECLDCCGYLCAATGRYLEAVTILGAADAFLRQRGVVEAPADAHRRQESLSEARQAFGPDRARAAQERGAAMSLATAAEYALMLTAPDPSAAAAPGPGALSPRERELVTLVAQGRTDAQIAAQLYISIRTVGSHLDRIRDKTGCRRRADLTRLALSTGLV
jgi:predicted ATPase/DNA-binding CsgD family transcriptional regulator